MGRIYFINERDERIEVNVRFADGAARNFALEQGVEERVNCNDGERLGWGWRPYSGGGGPLSHPRCVTTDGSVIRIRNDSDATTRDCRLSSEETGDVR